MSNQQILDYIWNEGCDLLEIAEDYHNGMQSGVFAGRRITKDTARVLGQQFLDRADAVFILHDSLKKELDKTV